MGITQTSVAERAARLAASPRVKLRVHMSTHTRLLFIGLLAAALHAGSPGVVFEGGKGPGKGKRVVLIAADQEYRSEEALPQLAKILSKRHGFTCTVLFA